MSTSRTGVVKWYDDVKQCRFITPDDGSADILVKVTTLREHGLKTLKKGIRFIFCDNRLVISSALMSLLVLV